MGIPVLDSITAGFKAIEKIADVVQQVGDFYRSKQMQELGALREERKVLLAENSELRGRLESLNAALGKPGSLSGTQQL